MKNITKYQHGLFARICSSQLGSIFWSNSFHLSGDLLLLLERKSPRLRIPIQLMLDLWTIHARRSRTKGQISVSLKMWYTTKKGRKWDFPSISHKKHVFTVLALIFVKKRQPLFSTREERVFNASNKINYKHECSKYEKTKVKTYNYISFCTSHLW